MGSIHTTKSGMANVMDVLTSWTCTKETERDGFKFYCAV